MSLAPVGFWAIDLQWRNKPQRANTQRSSLSHVYNIARVYVHPVGNTQILSKLFSSKYQTWMVKPVDLTCNYPQIIGTEDVKDQHADAIRRHVWKFLHDLLYSKITLIRKIYAKETVDWI